MKSIWRQEEKTKQRLIVEESWEHTKKTKEQSFKGRKDIIVKEEL